LPKHKTAVGRIAGAFFTCIFPGNIAQYQHRRNAFGLDTDKKRFIRLFFQPLLIAWALWSSGALRRTPNRAEQRQANQRLLKVLVLNPSSSTANLNVPTLVQNRDRKLLAANSAGRR